MRYNSAMDILGSVVLLSANGDPYKAAGVLSPNEHFGLGLLGGVVLIDPEMDEPYSLED